MKINLAAFGVILALSAPLGFGLGAQTAAAAPPSTRPIGSLDTAVASSAAIAVSGWAALPDSTQAIAVRVDVDGVSKLTATATLSRPDVAAAFPAVGAGHGFRLTVPGVSAGRHRVCVSSALGQPGRETTLGCATVTVPSGSPFGWLDTAVGRPDSRISVSGWAIDPDVTSAIPVHIYVDGTAAQSVDGRTQETMADTLRPDVGRAYPGFGDNHGFIATVAGFDAGEHSVCVYAINQGAAGPNALLTCKTVVVPGGVPFGAFDAATSMADGTVELRGWAIDPDVTSAVTVHVYVDGGYSRKLTAAAFRADVGRAYPGYGDAHGFSGSLVGLTQGTHRICTYALNQPVADNPQLGCLTVVVSDANAPALTSSEAPTFGVFGRAFDRDPDSAMLQAIRATSTGANSGEMDLIAKEPVATWFGDWNADVTSDVRARVAAADHRGAVATLVMYNIPDRDCGDYSANFGVSEDAYRAWTRAFVAGLGTSRHIVVIEPDAVPLISCLTPTQEQERYDLIGYAVDLLAAQGSWSYIDAGHTEWVTAEDMAGRLRASGVDRATGFSLNVSNFKPTDRTVAYGIQLSKLIGGKHFVVDTSRNGQGEDGNEWCNPNGMGLGSAPTTATSSPLVDAHLWVKPPGESDGGCNGGPAPGSWWRDYALMLIHNARW